MTSLSEVQYLVEPQYSVRLEYFHTQLGSKDLVRLLCGRSSPTVAALLLDPKFESFVGQLFTAFGSRVTAISFMAKAKKELFEALTGRAVLEILSALTEAKHRISFGSAFDNIELGTWRDRSGR